MGSKIPIKWPREVTTAFVEQLIQAEKDVQKAVLIFDAATKEYSNGFRHDHSTFGLIISRLLSANHFNLAEEMLFRMKDENCKITEDIFLSIYRAYGRVHKPVEVIRVFQTMKEYDCEPTQKSYITVFSVLVDENRLKTAFRFYRHMRGVGIPPCVSSLNILIKALCKNSGTMDSAFCVFHEMPKRGFTPDSYTYGTLINGLCRVGKATEAKELLMKMEANGCSPTVVTYTCLIRGFCQSNNLDEAMTLLEDMRSKSIEPNVFTYSSLMDGLCKGGRSSEAMELLQIMIHENKFPNMITYSTIIHGLCGEGKLGEALEIFDRMKLQGCKPDAGLYWKVINGFCDYSKFHEAANYLDEMILCGISPNRLTWSLHVKIHNAVVQGLCSANDPKRAFQLYLSMRTRAISVEAKSFETLLNHFCKEGDVHMVARIVEEMLIDGCIPDEQTWGVVMGVFWDRRKVREAADSVQADLMCKHMDLET